MAENDTKQGHAAMNSTVSFCECLTDRQLSILASEISDEAFVGPILVEIAARE